MVLKIYYEKSFNVTFLTLVCITVLLYIRSQNENISDKDRLSIQLAGFVTCIASFHYYYMISDIDRPVIYRYFDWFFTTPILLIDLCIMYNITNHDLYYKIVILNTLMLLFGFLGETGTISMISSTTLGFIPFIILFYMIKQNIDNIENIENKDNKLYNAFVILWSMYGLNHLYPDDKIKNINYNILDFTTKGLFGLYIYKETFRNIEK